MNIHTRYRALTEEAKDIGVDISGPGRPWTKARMGFEASRTEWAFGSEDHIGNFIERGRYSSGWWLDRLGEIARHMGWTLVEVDTAGCQVHLVLECNDVLPTDAAGALVRKAIAAIEAHMRDVKEATTK